ncbi:outer membrane channel protein [Rubripirellula lacrimiformis]|uniref:Outer membrane channel protein n=2 Tax=Rubripirellula lacrimiformis TaxID=1930273 RepID=A0A517N3Q4_9BACT|nr:outer membrane channel protein [Rubripirellula lacrimiformis]
MMPPPTDRRHWPSISLAQMGLVVGAAIAIGGCANHRAATQATPPDTVATANDEAARNPLAGKFKTIFQLVSTTRQPNHDAMLSAAPSAQESPNSTTRWFDAPGSIDSGMIEIPPELPEPDAAAATQYAPAMLEQFGEPMAVDPGTLPSLRPRTASSAPDRFVDLTEQEMLTLALNNSPVLRPLGIRVLDNPAAVTTVYDSAIAATDPFFGPSAALAEFDTRLSARLNSQNNDRVFNNSTLGGDVQELTQDASTLTTGIQKRWTSGGTFDFNTTHGYDNNNRAGNIFRNYWETEYEAGVRQPLLQGAGRTFNLIAGPNARPGFNFSNGILIARLNNRVTDAEFDIELRQFAENLYAVYWDLKRQYRNYESVLEAEQLAYRTWQSVLAKSRAKVGGGEANKEAQARAKYYSYRRQAQVALGGDGSQDGLYVIERRLRMLIGLPIVDDELLRPIDPTVSAPITFDYDALVTRAMTHRTELMAQSLRVQKQEMQLIAAKNFLLPQLDLIGRYRLRGFGDDLTGNGGRFASAYKDFFSGDHQEFEFGVEMGVTAGRRQAHAAVRNASMQIRRQRSILTEQQRSVRHQVSDAYAAVESSYAAMESSVAQAEASRTRLKSSEALFEADQIQIEFLLDAQEELLRAETQLASDQSRYAMSLVEINASTGSLLDDLGIHTYRDDCQTNPTFLTTDMPDAVANPIPFD